MTVLSACAEAAIELNQAEPATLFSTTDQFAKELRTQANKTALAVAEEYDWQKFLTLNTLTGNGSSTSFTLPADYVRMEKTADLLTSSFGRKLRKARDVNEWLSIQINTLNAATPGIWIIIGGTMNVRPAIASGETVKFYYVKNTIITSGTKTAFTADSDTFDLSERLITLGVIWRWRAQKRKDYAEDMRNFEIAQAKAQYADKGSRVLVVGQQRISANAVLAHPAIIV